MAVRFTLMLMSGYVAGYSGHSAPDTFGVRDMANDPWRTAWVGRASLRVAATH